MDPNVPPGFLTAVSSLLVAEPWAVVPEAAWRWPGSPPPNRVAANAAAAYVAERLGGMASAETFLDATTGREARVLLLVARNRAAWEIGLVEIQRQAAAEFGTITDTRTTEFPA
jgi:hypothetical protein